MSRFDGKLAVILGASSGAGFGAAIARRLAASGAAVVIGGRDRDGLDRVAADIGAIAQTCDITVESELADLFRLAADHGPVSIAINAAGVNHAAPIRKLEPDTIRKISDVHFLGTLLFIKHAARAIGERRGAILTISTLTATVPGAGLALYAGSKAGADHAVRVAAMEYGSQGIRVNSLSPGLSRTAMTDAYFAYPGFEAAFAAETPLGRLASTGDVAATAAWLCSDEAFITGQNIQVNGGASLTRLPRTDEIGAGA